MGRANTTSAQQQILAMSPLATYFLYSSTATVEINKAARCVKARVGREGGEGPGLEDAEDEGTGIVVPQSAPVILLQRQDA
jgi:hypothetical protein